jgi:hypothetical protein
MGSACPPSNTPIAAPIARCRLIARQVVGVGELVDRLEQALGKHPADDRSVVPPAALRRP